MVALLLEVNAMTHVRSRRAQVVLPEDEYRLLEEYAKETKQSVSLVIREVIRKSLITDLEKQRKLQALARLAAGDAPVEDWPEMEREIETMWEEPNAS
jgi:hypothetical protein